MCGNPQGQWRAADLGGAANRRERLLFISPIAGCFAIFTTVFLGKLLKYLRILAITGISLYALLCLLLYLFQDKLLFYPQPRSIRDTGLFLEQHPELDTLGMNTKDGTRINFYVSRDTGTLKKPLLIYFGGNAEEVSHLAAYSRHFEGYRLALVNYRGYGLCQGKPSESTMFSDALEVYDHLKQDPATDPAHIVVMGRSIGTGVATYLSAQRPVKATVLITPYESMTAVASEKYAYVPITLLLKHPFDSQRYAREAGNPLLAIVASNDAVIPKQHGHALARQWKGQAEALEVAADHSSVMQSSEAWERISAFLEEQRR